LLGGNHVAASPSPFFWLIDAVVARRLIGSFAKFLRLTASHCCAPFCHASDSATTVDHRADLLGATTIALAAPALPRQIAKRRVRRLIWAVGQIEIPIIPHL
jgi:hypothetical protein